MGMRLNNNPNVDKVEVEVQLKIQQEQCLSQYKTSLHVLHLLVCSGYRFL
jgi:hypothetical protein